MNRREMLKCAAGSLAALVLPNTAMTTPPKQSSWFTHKELMHLFNQLDCDGKTASETVDIAKLMDWNGEILKSYELIHLAIIRMSNIMHRRSLDSQSGYWLVVSPDTCKHENWAPYQFGGKYSTPGKTGGVWTKEPWQKFIQEEVSSGVYKVGNICSKWTFYVDKLFPDNKIMLGMGYKHVVRFRYEGMKQCDWGECPNVIPYMGRPTANNYAIITLG